MKICGIYKITNTVTGDFYIGSSKDIKRRFTSHKWPSMWNKHLNSPMYLDMQKYGLDSFVFEILAEVEPGSLKETEQQFIETLKPTYNSNRANGLNIERRKETNKKASRKYYKSDKGKESQRKAQNKYNNQLCLYNNEILTLCALVHRFSRAGIPHPTTEAKKYLLEQ